MSYIVVYLRADGSSGVEECADLDLAVVAAERLRNVDSVERPRIFKTEEVTYDFKPYYRVEVTTSDEAGGSDWVGHSSSAAAAVTPAPPIAAPAAEVVEEVAPVADEVEDVPVVEEVAAEVVEEQPPAPPAPTPTESDAESSGDVDPLTKKGLFGDPVPEPEPVVETPEASPLAEDVKDSVPPRRGLFGR